MSERSTSPNQLPKLLVWFGRRKGFAFSLVILMVLIGFFIGAYLHSVASVGSIRITCATPTPYVFGFVLAIGIENPSLFSVDTEFTIYFSKPSVNPTTSGSERAFNIPARSTVVEFFSFETDQQYPGTLRVFSTYDFLVVGLGNLQLSFKFQTNDTIDGSTIPQTGCGVQR